MLQVENVHAGYGRIPVLTGINFTLTDGQVIGVLGHNGMGKTTLLKTLVGQTSLTSGAIRFDDADITHKSSFLRARAGIGYVPQGRAIFPKLSALDNLRMGFVPSRDLSEEEAIKGIVTEFPRLASILDRAGGALSGGEQQILALARCLCGRPKLLLLDEPTEGIQPSIVDEILQVLIRLHLERGLAIVVVEQHLDFIRRLSDRVLLIEKGAITGEISPDKVDEVQEYGGYVSAG
ncbi:branched-chain amino acid transport system ATP-binding protein [Bradyrhizobium sp. AZCC 2262]|uniref:ABC transporter ATP-binding protein n=1 Tax=Bradyrhizobium sp. AZCC 2262 TaxID=3117022 RepID=UPI002FF0BD00